MFERFKRFIKVVKEGDDQFADYHPQMVTIGGNEYVIRKATLNDIPDLINIENSVYGKSPWDETSFKMDMSRKRCLYLVVVNPINRRIVAFIGTLFNGYSADCHISNIGVMNQYQHHGIGSKLISTQIMIGRHLKMLTMSLEVRVSNTDAQHLYQKLGFTVQRTRWQYYLDNGENAYEMVKQL